MRVTFNQVRDGLDSINTAAEQFAQAQWQVSTGLRIRVPSDDPDAARRAITDQSSIDEVDAYKGVSDSASSRLTALDGALGNIVDKITAALVALQSAQGSTATQAVRDAAAATFDGVRDSIAADINTSFGGVHLFAGTKSDQSPYARVSGAWVYQGTNTQATVDTGNGRSVAIGVDGQAILQGGDAQDVLTLLDSLAAAARNNDAPALLAGVAALNNAANRTSRAQGQVGYDETTIADGEQTLTALKLAGAARLSSDREANMAEAMTRMSKAQTTYQAALGAVAASSKVSLLDYLR
jgi:flagellar hook-associated protein 3 FlgL